MILLKTGLWETDSNLTLTLAELSDDPTSSYVDVSLLEEDDPKWDEIIKQVVTDGRCLSV